LNQGYGYDDLDRLTSVTKTGGNQSFTYDANGNRLTYGNGAANSTYTISGTSNRLSSISGSQARTYTYNAVGAVEGDGSKTFVYYDRERLKSATVAGATWTYYYNGLGERVRKNLAPTGNHYYVYDEAGHLIGEYNGNTLIQETVWLGDIPVATLRGSSIYYVHTDHLNAPKKVTQTNNGVRWSWDRDPFGTTTVNQNPSGLGTFSYNLRLPGQFFDSETGLHYNYFRDYDASVGRYIKSDPIGLLGGINTYGYVNGNPVLASDALGLACMAINECALTCLRKYEETLHLNLAEYVDASSKCRLIVARTGYTSQTCLFGVTIFYDAANRYGRGIRDKCLENCR
jgi:RHS repeat-associated protein